jgi:hypothetical protein
MSTSTDRQLFRTTVAQVAEQARAILPQAVNGRVESAIKLVLAQDVITLPDGRIEVGSSSDPLKVYKLEGSACTCQDFVYGKAPDGWCAHKIAANLQRSVERVLARAPLLPVDPEMVEPWADNDPEPEPEAVEVPCAPTAPAPLPEAAFSLTLKGTLDGQEALLTARGQTAAEFRANLAAIRGLLDARPQPQTPAQASSPAQPLSPQQHNAAAMHRPVTGFCQIHNVEMKWNEGRDGRKGWHSHRADDGSWCKGRG